MSTQEPGGATRRVVLAGVGVATAAVLTGCATYDQRGAAANPPPNNNNGGTDNAAGGSDPPAQGPLARTTDIPVGGGVVLDQQNIVITQPEAGTFKAFTATCTHQGCQVADVKGGTINCPCHGSKFKIADGSVANGPAARPLREIGITVKGTDIARD